MQTFLSFILGIVTVLSGYGFYTDTTPKEMVESLGSTMTGSTWFLNTSSQIQAGAATWGLRVPSLSSSGDCLVTDVNGVVSTSTCGAGGGWTFSSTTIWGLFSNTATGLTYNSSTGATSLTDGYGIPTTTRMNTWDTAYSWGNHAGLYDPLGQATSTLASHTTAYNHNNFLTTVDISTNTNLSADGTEIILTGDALSLGTALTFTTGTSTTAFFSGLGTFTNTVVTTLGTFLNATFTGLVDIGAGVLEIPNGTAPTVDSIGEIALDSTSNQLVLYGSEKKVIGNGNFYPAFTYATSTAWTGTTTIPLGTAFVAETWNGVQCFTDAGTLNVSFTDGTNRMNAINASTTVGTVTLSTNNTFTASEKRYIEVGTPASSPTKISCTISKSLISD